VVEVPGPERSEDVLPRRIVEAGSLAARRRRHACIGKGLSDAPRPVSNAAGAVMNAKLWRRAAAHSARRLDAPWRQIVDRTGDGRRRSPRGVKSAHRLEIRWG